MFQRPALADAKVMPWKIIISERLDNYNGR